MKIGDFKKLAEELTGTALKEVSPEEDGILERILADDATPLGHSQLNELLLLVNKDRISAAFFDHFFGVSCTVGTLASGVTAFRKAAMLCYGNFIHAYRTLSQAATKEALDVHLGEWGRPPNQLKSDLAARAPTLVSIERIAKEDTYFVGYLSGAEVAAEKGRCNLLRGAFPPAEELDRATWDTFIESVSAKVSKEERSIVSGMIETFRATQPQAPIAMFSEHLEQAWNVIEANAARLKSVRAAATSNQMIYLTWDHMDVYFATSMRKRWEFEDLFDFVSATTSHPTLQSLRLRTFDPTQAYTDDRVGKGLVEALMLKRAKCTIYSVQDTDTLGKDSELAATLAQGKPVIAYVPAITVDTRSSELAKQDPATIQERLRFVLYADEKFAQSVGPTELLFVREYKALEEFERERLWRTVPDPTGVAAFRTTNTEQLERICRLIAAGEARIYDKRAQTLTDNHPLGIQVNLGTGVANGVLVVRRVDDCAELLRRIVTNELEFDIKETKTSYELRERISGCVYRVVTKDRKLTNCFWNFYRGAQG